MDLATRIEQLAEIMTANYAYLLLYLEAKAEERGQKTLVVRSGHLAELINMSRFTVRRGFNYLNDNGFIKIETRDRRTSIIHIINIAESLDKVKSTLKDRTLPLEVRTEIAQERTAGAPVAHKKRTKTSIYTAGFESLWERYPRPIGKKAAFGHFRASVIVPEDWEAIQKALDNYLQGIKSGATEERFIQHGSTWFNNWRDWIPVPAAPVSREAARPNPPEPEPGPRMTPEEMREIREQNMGKKPETIPKEDVNDVVVRLAGGSRRMPE
jgi:DNA-binding transcriptional regulator YhcF (GntR family)